VLDKLNREHLIGPPAPPPTGTPPTGTPPTEA